MSDLTGHSPVLICWVFIVPAFVFILLARFVSGFVEDKRRGDFPVFVVSDECDPDLERALEWGRPLRNFVSYEAFLRWRENHPRIGDWPRMEDVPEQDRDMAAGYWMEVGERA